MRPLAVPAVLIILLSAASPAFAGVGLPQIASVQAGKYQVKVYSSSPGARTGANLFTVEIPKLEQGSLVKLTLTGPTGQIISVPLKPLRLLESQDETHSTDDESHTGTADAHSDPASDHASEANAHTDHPSDNASEANAHTESTSAKDEPTGDGHKADVHEADAHGGIGFAAAAYLVRGTARIASVGDWMADIEITNPHGEKHLGSFPLHAEQGGPNRTFISVTGILMGGSILYGVVKGHSPRRKWRNY